MEHSGAHGFLGETAPSLLPNPGPTELKLKMSSTIPRCLNPRHKRANTLLEETTQRAISTPRAKSAKGQGLQVCISVGYGEC